jgi:DNA polymerase-4
VNQNSLSPKTEARVLFIDMDSFFARCEQQANYWLRNRPVGVCVYTGKYGCVISPSKEAKLRGVKTGMRLNDAILLCPELVPLETNPARYRDYHVKIIQVLKKYSQDIVPKSIDEAIVNLEKYKLVHPDPVKVANQIKKDIYSEVGDWLSCSIGIAPNAFLAKLGSNLGKKTPNGLFVITPQNIDEVLKPLTLRALPGIGSNMTTRLERAGIKDALAMRYAGPDMLKRIFKSVEGIYWHYRLNFIETDISSSKYRGMQAMRQLSAENRSKPEFVEQTLRTLCLTLERRMTKHEYYCKSMGFSLHYTDESRWDDGITLTTPIQDGVAILNIIRKRMNDFEQATGSSSLLNTRVSAIRIAVTNFVDNGDRMYSLFEDIDQQEIARKTLYSIKERFGNSKLVRAAELTDGHVLKDVIGFGSVKDLTELDYIS